MILRPLPLLPATLALLGCGQSLSTARTAVNAAADLYQTTKAPLEQRYEAEQIACLDQRPAPPEPCVTSVRASWKPVRLAEEAFYRSILLAQSVVGTAEAGAVLGKRVDVGQVMVVVGSAIDAGEKLRDAIQALHRSTEQPPPTKPKASPWIPWSGPPVEPSKPGGAQ